jgi:hypothetical protein
MARSCLVLLALSMLAIAHAEASAPVEDLRKEVEQLRKEISGRNDAKLSPIGAVDRVTESKYGPGAQTETKSGKLQIGGLVQVWYQHIGNDNVGIVKAAPGNNLDPAPGAGAASGPEQNETLDNDTFRVRRTELRFTLDIHENITAYVMIDPARETNELFTPAPTFSLHNAAFSNPGLADGIGQQLPGANIIIPQILQDAYINYHGVVPHHDFTIGQFKPPSGEESWRNSGQLDFVERAMVTTTNNMRDIGLMVHGSFFEERLQYWAGVFNGPDGTVLTDPDYDEGGNRSDDNDAKDIAWRILARPVWSESAWYGRLELGYARTDGWRGESGHGFDPDRAVNGLNRQQTAINRNAAWAWYRPNGPVKGMWLRGEWGSYRDIFPVPDATSLLGLGSGPLGQLDPKSATVSGWYAATGYRLFESIFADRLKNSGGVTNWMNNLEFAFRYEIYQNIAAEDLVRPDREVDLFKTQVVTLGMNYYIKKHDAKIQANYIIVDEPSDHNPNRGLREVNNNMFILNFQVMF